MSSTKRQDDQYQILARLEDRIKMLEAGSGMVALGEVSGAGATSITFSSIPQTFRHLRLLVVAQSNKATVTQTGFGFRLNGISTSSYFINYWGHRSSQGSNVINSGYLNLTLGYLGQAPANGRLNDSCVSLMTVDIPYYSKAGVQKHVLGFSSMSDEVAVIEGLNTTTLFQSSAVINSIQLIDDVAGTLGPQATASLYGIS